MRLIASWFVMLLFLWLATHNAAISVVGALVCVLLCSFVALVEQRLCFDAYKRANMMASKLYKNGTTQQQHYDSEV